MTVNFNNVEEGIANAVRLAIGSELYQLTDNTGAYGVVITSHLGVDEGRQNYPYVHVDLLMAQKDSGTAPVEVWDNLSNTMTYEAIELLTYQITVYSKDGDTLRLAEKLRSAFVVAPLRDALEAKGATFAWVDNVVSNPSMEGTDFVEQGSFNLYVRAKDTITITDPNYAAVFDSVVFDLNLKRSVDDLIPLTIHVNVQP